MARLICNNCGYTIFDIGAVNLLLSLKREWKDIKKRIRPAAKGVAPCPAFFCKNGELFLERIVTDDSIMQRFGGD